MNFEDMLKFLNFSLNDDKSSYTVKCRSNVAPISIEIPSTYLGKPVTSIGERAFADCKSLTSIDIPDGVTSIGKGAFYSCESLTSIVIPDGVTSIGKGAFYSCESLTIYAEASSKPFGWDKSWNSSYRPVVWACYG